MQTGLLFREKQKKTWIQALPRWYSPWAHLLTTVGICAIAMATAALMAHDIGVWEWLAVPGAVIFANFFEWFAHKNVMHRLWRPLRVLYRKHTLMHHRAYVHDDMAMRDWRETAFVLLPAAGIIGIVVTVLLVGIPAGLLFGANVGWLVAFTLNAYVLAYELSHLAYHLPSGHPVSRLPFIARLSAHHARHHDPRRMNDGNFNVTVPLADVVLGTVLSRGDES